MARSKSRRLWYFRLSLQSGELNMSAKTTVAVVLPVYNEEVDIPRSVPVLHRFLKTNFKSYAWELIIADNGPSRDRTAEVSRKLEHALSGVRYVLISRPGRGNALKEVWLKSDADILCYMDVDLSSELKYFPRLVKVLEQGADVAIGSRLARGAKVYGRTLTREVMSRGYNLLIKIFFWTGFHDAQCGFKGIRRETAQKLLPYVEDKGWFFDSELLVLAEKTGYKVAEIPIVWRDDPRSTVKVAKTAWGDIKGLIRLFLNRPWKSIAKKK